VRSIDQIVRDLNLAGKEDYVGIWQIMSAVTHNFKLSNPADVRRLTLDVVRGLLVSGARAVDLTPGGGCTPWQDQRPDAVVARVNNGWDSLGREPDIGDIVWFDF